MLGSIFLHLAIESSSPQIRRSTYSTIERLATTLPEHVNASVLAACAAYLSREKTVTKANGAGEEQDSSANKEARLPAFMLASAAFREDCPVDIKQRMLALHEENVSLKEQYKTAQDKLVKAKAVSLF